ncbi:D-hexose-6-phosphate mutarotase [Prolixibacteraceae bacterium Z1-6]|uniref:Putative glucose-6-phosphate 1-epimerase n=1 Tax=Draconibacterium aestuarii TaxID=2998507 RepID=A0A9X3FFL5_9BACT|nr:D-hexose-6-phosphate mutarotase [Prolixibacteraceae bacterium Z1-6]
MNTDELNDRFGIEGEIGFYEEEDLIFAMVSNKFADATISLYGAQILNFNPVRNMEILWMSSESYLEKGKAIRGGIPVCFPWFGMHETDEKMPQHGFARIMDWEVSKAEILAGGESLITMQLCSSEETKKYWPYDFCAEMIFIVGNQLSVTLKVTNTSGEPIDYTCALHTYFSLSAIENITIEGLQNTRYQNQLDGGDYLQEKPLLKIKEATTHHYYDTEQTCVINDPVYNRRISIKKQGSKNSTVWNPWTETCAKLGDIADDGYHTFVCLETVNKINDIIELAPGETHETTSIIGIEE